MICSMLFGSTPETFRSARRRSTSGRWSIRSLLTLGSPNPPARSTSTDPPQVTALADPQRTWQILSNLVSNALKFSPPDTAVQVRLRSGDGSVAVEVADHGPGVPAEQREMLFGRFARLPSSVTTPGAGLGLFIARSLAEVQGGGLELAGPSSEGGGATFTLTLPDAGPA